MTTTAAQLPTTGSTRPIPAGTAPAARPAPTMPRHLLSAGDLTRGSAELILDTAERIDQAMAVENSDLVVVPKGYHPVSVPYGYESYYLNVMAGPKRAWHFHNDPQHSWLLDL